MIPKHRESTIFKIKIENKKASLDSGKQINMEHNLTYNSQIKAITELLENDKTEKEQIIKILFTTIEYIFCFIACERESYS